MLYERQPPLISSSRLAGEGAVGRKLQSSIAEFGIDLFSVAKLYYNPHSLLMGLLNRK